MTKHHDVSRRTVLQTAAAGLAGLSLARGSRGAAERQLPRLGLQLYTLRSQMARDFEGTLAKVAELGIEEVEFAGYYERTPEKVGAILEANGLRAPAAHTLIGPLEDDLDRLLDECQALGHQYLVMAYLLPNQRALEDYRRHIDVLAAAGERCREVGIRLGYHNHDFEFEQIGEEGVVPYDLILASLGSDVLAMELDLFWIQKAGARAHDYFVNHPGRFPLLHVKDLDEGTGSFTEVGSGIVPFPEIFADNESSGAKHFFIEQDIIQGDAFESLAKSVAYLKQLRF